MESAQKTVVILAARMDSTRLPGKTLANVGGQPMLALLINRVRSAKLFDELVVATTHLPQDDAIVSLARDLGVANFRGHPSDCLDRYYWAAQEFDAGIIVRITGDNPLIDADFVDWTIQEYRSTHPPCDFLDTITSGTFPLGLTVEIFSAEALATAWQEDTNPGWREHVTPFFLKHPERFRLQFPVSPRRYPPMRVTVDEIEDLLYVRQICTHFGRTDFSVDEMVAAVKEHPEWANINMHVDQRQF